MRTAWLHTWVLEGSLDGMTWTEIDRQTNDQNFQDHLSQASFPVSSPTECRFIRLSQPGKNRGGYACLHLAAVEFFGTLSE
jgi:transposase